MSEQNLCPTYRILKLDPWIEPFAEDIQLRMKTLRQTRQALLPPGEKVTDWANGHHFFGFHRREDGWVYREWAPAAQALFLTGDFNEWNRQSHPLSRRQNGVWEIVLDGSDTLLHQSKVKVVVHQDQGAQDRIPLYCRRVIQDPQTHDFCGQIWDPPQPYVWQHPDFRVDSNRETFIYEVHVGMAQEKPGMGTYREFTEKILPRIAGQGYTAIQIMAVMQHPYYASFGYHVANYFAASSWFGTPEDLKALIDRAHELGLAVLMDLVQSHAVKNQAEGINGFDGSQTQFFHAGERGEHQAWDSKLFNYGKHEVIHFLLSCVKFWLEEYHFDGFRFDGVTSMIYHDHGLGTAFDRYDKYFSLNTDLEAITYLQLVNELIRELRPDAISVAEDMSGMPGMCLPIEDGGIGFDYRLAMGLPDFWIRSLETKDEAWSMRDLWHELTTARPHEKRIAYVESHDQALVGDKTLMFRMADQEMYWNMAKDSQSLIIDRAVALHKMIRLITLTSGAEGYLNFMGNEFGHPEWIDFPRAGNQWSYHYCRRQWSLADDPNLRYQDLLTFDQAMLELVQQRGLLGQLAVNLWIDENKKILAYCQGDAVFLFNFHPLRSFDEFWLPLPTSRKYRVILDSDEKRFGGQARIDHEIKYWAMPRADSELLTAPIYTPCRTAMVLWPTDRD